MTEQEPRPERAPGPATGPLPGQELDGLRIVEEVGRQATAVLYRATVLANSRPALLLAFRVPLAEEQFVTGLRWAARALASLQRAAVAGVIGWGKQPDGRLYLVLEDVPGRPLADYLAAPAAAGEPLDAERSLRLIAQLATSLQAALKLGVVHKELRPEYIMLRPDGAPTLLGLELPLPAAEKFGQAARYLSPEQRQGQALDARGNLYSLGVVLYDLLTQGDYLTTPPAKLPSLEEVRPKLSEPTRQLVAKLLEPASWARYQTYPAALAALDEALAAESGADPAALAGARSRPATRRLPPLADLRARRREAMPYLAAVVALGALLAVGLLAVLLSLFFDAGVSGGEGLSARPGPEVEASLAPGRERSEADEPGQAGLTPLPPTRPLPAAGLGQAASATPSPAFAGVPTDALATPTPTLAEPTETPAASPTAGLPAGTPPAPTSTSPLPPPTFPPPEPSNTPIPTNTPAPTNTPQPTSPPPPPTSTSPPPPTNTPPAEPSDTPIPTATSPLPTLPLPTATPPIPVTATPPLPRAGP
ncbi:MAG: protein kinase domain-containing protein [Candidatus Promineifilaceae bacterium]